MMAINDDILFDDLLGELGLIDEPNNKKTTEEKTRVNNDNLLGKELNDKKKKSSDDDLLFASYVPSSRQPNRKREIALSNEPEKPLIESSATDDLQPKRRWNGRRNAERRRNSFELDWENEKEETKASSDLFDERFSWLSGKDSKTQKPIENKNEAINGNKVPESKQIKKNELNITKDVEKPNKANDLALEIRPEEKVQRSQVQLTEKLFDPELGTPGKILHPGQLIQKEEFSKRSLEELKDWFRVEMKQLISNLNGELGQIKQNSSEKNSSDYLQSLKQIETDNEMFSAKLNLCHDKISELEEKLDKKLDELKNSSSSIAEANKSEFIKLKDLIENEYKVNRQNHSHYTEEIDRFMEKLQSEQKRDTKIILQKLEKNDEKNITLNDQTEMIIKKEWARLEKEKKLLSHKANTIHNSWETAFKQLSTDQSNFLTAQSKLLQEKEISAKESKHRIEEEEILNKRRLKLQEDENNLMQLAKQLKTSSNQLENVCKLAIQMRDESMSATVQLAKLVNSSYRINKCCKHASNSTTNPGVHVLRHNTKVITRKTPSIIKWQEFARQDRQSLDLEKLYLNLCKTRSSPI